MSEQGEVEQSPQPLDGITHKMHLEVGHASEIDSIAISAIDPATGKPCQPITIRATPAAHAGSAPVSLKSGPEDALGELIKLGKEKHFSIQIRVSGPEDVCHEHPDLPQCHSAPLAFETIQVSIKLKE